jgi:hypothetical protein
MFIFDPSPRGLFCYNLGQAGASEHLLNFQPDLLTSLAQLDALNHTDHFG